MKLKSFSVLAAVVLIIACNNKDTANSDELNTFSADSLGNRIAILSSDGFTGRKPFTEGETKTINYLRDQFIAAGLEPGNGNSYFQEVPMVRIATVPNATMEVSSPRGNFSLKGFDDYVIWTDRTDPALSWKNAEVVFAGYGVVAPEYGWNDYAGLDVKGKIALVLVNDPGFNAGDSTLFKGNAMTYYGRWTYKFEEAARQGAAGCLIVHNTKAASYPFTVVQNNWKGSRLRIDNRGTKESLCDMIGWLSGDAAAKLLEAAGKDSNLFASADKKEFRGMPLGVKLSTAMTVTTTYNKSHNVIAKITGTEKPEETIIYSAHWDHLGIGKPDETGDSIYNGALDNASATAGLFELARAFRSAKTPPRRTVVFLAVTAEEQGLWGSAWYATHPIFPAASTIANINMDGLNWYGATKDIIVIGKGQNELEDYLTEAATAADRVVNFESHPEAGSYYRSDHFNFAKVGIPALYTASGIQLIDASRGDGQKIHDAYTEKNYHRPSDEYDKATWALDGAIADLKLMYMVGKRLATGNEWPGWKEGSEFKALRQNAAK